MSSVIRLDEEFEKELRKLAPQQGTIWAVPFQIVKERSEDGDWDEYKFYWTQGGKADFRGDLAFTLTDTQFETFKLNMEDDVS